MTRGPAAGHVSANYPPSPSGRLKSLIEINDRLRNPRRELRVLVSGFLFRTLYLFNRLKKVKAKIRKTSWLLHVVIFFFFLTHVWIIEQLGRRKKEMEGRNKRPEAMCLGVVWRECAPTEVFHSHTHTHIHTHTYTKALLELHTRDTSGDTHLPSPPVRRTEWMRPGLRVRQRVISLSIERTSLGSSYFFSSLSQLSVKPWIFIYKKKIIFLHQTFSISIERCAAGTILRNSTETCTAVMNFRRQTRVVEGRRGFFHFESLLY